MNANICAVRSSSDNSLRAIEVSLAYPVAEIGRKFPNILAPSYVFNQIVYFNQHVHSFLFLIQRKKLYIAAVVAQW